MYLKVLKEVLKLAWMVMLVLNTSACHRAEQRDSKVDTSLEQTSDCRGLFKTLESCPIQRDASDRAHMIAILREQMNGLSEQDKQKRCHELQSFWQVACGVTPKH